MAPNFLSTLDSSLWRLTPLPKWLEDYLSCGFQAEFAFSTPANPAPYETSFSFEWHLPDGDFLEVNFLLEGRTYLNPTFIQDTSQWCLFIGKETEGIDGEGYSALGFCTTGLYAKLNCKGEILQVSRYSLGNDEHRFVRCLFWLGLSFEEISKHFTVSQHEMMELKLERNELIISRNLGA